MAGGARFQTALVFSAIRRSTFGKCFPGHAPVLRLDDPEAKRGRHQVVDVTDPGDAHYRVGNRGAGCREGVLDDLSCTGLGVLALLEAVEAVEAVEAGALKEPSGPPENPQDDQHGARHDGRAPPAVEPEPEDCGQRLTDAKSRDEPTREDQEQKQLDASPACVRAR